MTIITRLASLAVIFTWMSAARAEDPSVSGALVGGSELNFTLEAGRHQGDAVLAANTPRQSVAGYFGMLRLQAGFLLRVTRFGTEAGLEGSLALGVISSAAYGDSPEFHWAADISMGVVLVPLRLKALGGTAFKLAGGLGSDHDADYLYASARLGFGEDHGGQGFELGYNYRAGDTPVGAPLNEHRFGAMFLFDDADLQLGLSYGFGRTYRYLGSGATRVELADPGTMRKGTYSDLVLSIGYVFD